MAPGLEVRQVIGGVEQAEAVLDLRVGQVQAIGQRLPAFRERVPENSHQPQDFTMQAGQFAADAGSQPHGFQGVELPQGTVRVGIAGTGGCDVNAQGAEAGLRPEQCDPGLGQLEIVIPAGQERGDGGKDDFFAVGVDRVALFNLELASGKSAYEITQHAGDVVEEGAFGMGRPVRA